VKLGNKNMVGELRRFGVEHEKEDSKGNERRSLIY